MAKILQIRAGISNQSKEIFNRGRKLQIGVGGIINWGRDFKLGLGLQIGAEHREYLYKILDQKRQKRRN